MRTRRLFARNIQTIETFTTVTLVLFSRGHFKKRNIRNFLLYNHDVLNYNKNQFFKLYFSMEISKY